MLKWEEVDLDFAEKCSNFVVATEQAAIGQGLLRFLVALQAQNYPGLGKIKSEIVKIRSEIVFSNSFLVQFRWCVVDRKRHKKGV